jgi:phage regulator Rha-like protein
MKDLIPTEQIEQTIFIIRGHRVMLDEDLSRLYGVTTKRLNEQIKRNQKRFPDDFIFQLNSQEVARLRSQNATLKSGRGRHRKYLPYAFTEHGAIMAANVLNSQRAIDASVYVVRAFVKLRELIASNKGLAKRLDELEKKYDSQFKVVFDAIRELMTPVEPPPTPRIGFRA